MVWVSQRKKESLAGLTKKESGQPRKQPLTQEAYITNLEMENELLNEFHTEFRKLTTVKRNIGSLNTTEEDIQRKSWFWTLIKPPRALMDTGKLKNG